MKIISFKDYCYSLRRGGLFNNVGLILIYILKQIIFKTIAIFFLFQTKKKFEVDKIKKIGIYIPESSGMGDLIMSNLFFRSVRELFASAEIIIFTKNGIVVDKLNFDKIVDIGKLSFFKQLSNLNQQKFDLLLFPEKSINGSLFFLFLNSFFKLGYLSSYCVKANFKIGGFNFIPHQNHYYLKSFLLIKAIQSHVDHNVISYKPDLSFMEEKATIFLVDYVVFIPCVSWSNRSISFEDSKIVVSEVLKSKFHIFLSGGQESLQTNQALLKEFAHMKDKILFVEKLNFIDFANVIKKSKGVICGDSGPLHIAFGFEKPVLSFWGPTFPELRVPSINAPNSVIIFEKERCHVTNCFNMEHRPFCQTCLRLENIPNFANKIKTFLLSI